MEVCEVSFTLDLQRTNKDSEQSERRSFAPSTALSLHCRMQKRVLETRHSNPRMNIDHSITISNRSKRQTEISCLMPTRQKEIYPLDAGAADSQTSKHESKQKKNRITRHCSSGMLPNSLSFKRTSSGTVQSRSDFPALFSWDASKHPILQADVFRHKAQQQHLSSIP